MNRIDTPEDTAKTLPEDMNDESKQSMSEPVATDEFVVSDIVDHDWDSDGDLKYRIRWEGYGSNDDTWQSQSDLSDCQKLLKQYESNLPPKSQKEYKKYRNGKPPKPGRQDKKKKKEESRKAKNKKRQQNQSNINQIQEKTEKKDEESECVNNNSIQEPESPLLNSKKQLNFDNQGPEKSEEAINKQEQERKLREEIEEKERAEIEKKEHEKRLKEQKKKQEEKRQQERLKQEEEKKKEEEKKRQEDEKKKKEEERLIREEEQKREEERLLKEKCEQEEKRLLEEEEKKLEAEPKKKEKQKIKRSKKTKESSNITLRKRKKKKEEKKDESDRYDSDGNEIFFPEKILDDRECKKGRGRGRPKKKKNGEVIREYLVKWHYYPDKANTWEHEDNLAGASKMVEEYWESKKKDELKPKKAKRVHKAQRRSVTEALENDVSDDDAEIGEKRKLDNNENDNPVKKRKLMSQEEIEKEWENKNGDEFKQYCLRVKSENPEKFFEFFRECI